MKHKIFFFLAGAILMGIVMLSIYSFLEKTPTILASYDNLYQRSMILFKGEKESISKDGFLPLSQSEQKERFFLQKLHSNNEFGFPLPTLAQINIANQLINPPASGAYITLGGEDESFCPLSYTGTLHFPDKNLRYPFELKAKYFKGLKLSVEALTGEGNIKIEKTYMNSQEEITYNEKVYEVSSGKKYIIPLFEKELSPVDPAVDRYKIYISSSLDGSLFKYEFLFQDNTH